MATYHVATTGNDSNNGTTLALAKLHIKNGWQLCVAGDTLLVHAGTYRESMIYQNMTFPNGTAAAPIMILSAPGETVTIAPPLGQAGFYLIDINQDPAINTQIGTIGASGGGFIFDGEYVSGSGIVTNAGSGIKTSNIGRGVWAGGTAYVTGDVVQVSGYIYRALQSSTGQNPTTTIGFWEQILDYGLRIVGNIFTRTAQMAILNGDGFAGTQIIRNTFTNCGHAIQTTPPIQANYTIYNLSYLTVIDGNTISGSGNYSIHMYSQFNLAHQGIVRNNIFKNGGAIDSANYVLMTGGYNVGPNASYVYNNLFYGGTNAHAVYGIDTLNGLVNLYVLNNTFFDIDGYGVQLGSQDTMANITIKNNIFRNTATAGSDSGGALTPVRSFSANVTNLVCATNLGTTSGGCSGNTNPDPSFVNVAAGSEDLHLSSASSLAYQTGSNLSSLNTSNLNNVTINLGVDKDGVSRGAGVWDIGAYQFTAGVTPPNTPAIELFNYTTGVDLNGLNAGTYWDGPWTKNSGLISIAVAPSGSTSGGNAALCQTTGTVAFYVRSMAAVATGTFKWQMRSSSTATGLYQVVALASGGVNFAHITMFGDGHFWANKNTGAAEADLGAYTANLFHLVEVEFDASGHSSQYRVRLNGGTFSAWIVTAATLTTSQVDSFIIYDASTIAHDFWVDTINDSPPAPLVGFELRRNTLAGGSANGATLDSGASSTNNFYNGNAITITTGTGAEQFAIIGAYNGTTKVATTNPPWVTPPVSGSGYVITPRSGGVVLRQNTATGGGASSITLDAGASSVNQYYARPGSGILLNGGTGIGQVRLITGYNGSTKIATVNQPWITQPISGTTFTLFVR